MVIVMHLAHIVNRIGEMEIWLLDVSLLPS